MYQELQTLEAHGIPRTEVRWQPEYPDEDKHPSLSNMKLIEQGTQDKLKWIPARFPTNIDYMRGYQAPGAEYVTEIQHEGSELSHFLITLVHRFTRSEKLVDLLTDTFGLSTIRAILNCHFGGDWGVFEVLGLDEPF
jgi:hypothetical protein